MNTSLMSLTARCPEDVLAMVPVVLGFLPTDSVVMLTFGGQETFHARIDLPTGSESEEPVCDALLAPAVRHRVERVLFVVFSEDERHTRRLGRRLERDFTRAGIDVVEMLRTDGGRWFPRVGKRAGVPEWGVPYDLSGHRFAAEAVLHGRVTHGSREDLEVLVAADEERVAAVAATMQGTPALWEPGSIPHPTVLLNEGAWVQALLGDHLGTDRQVGDADLVRLLRGLSTLRVRDAAWALIERSSAQDHITFWTDVVRRCPMQWIAPPATLLGWAAWQAGHGALAWCAVDRAAEGDADYTLLGYLSHVLEHAVPPSSWTPATAWDEGLQPGA